MAKIHRRRIIALEAALQQLEASADRNRGQGRRAGLPPAPRAPADGVSVPAAPPPTVVAVPDATSTAEAAASAAATPPGGAMVEREDWKRMWNGKWMQQ